jgi:two-component system OmpR family response regulator
MDHQCWQVSQRPAKDPLRDGRLPTTAVIVLGPNIDVRIKVAFLELGADDYMVQPFDSSEMMARLRAVIRRSQVQHVAVGLKKEIPLNPGGNR